MARIGPFGILVWRGLDRVGTATEEVEELTDRGPDREVRRETVVTEGSGTGAGVVVGVVVAIVAVLLVVWLIFGLEDDEADVVPDEVDVTVNVEDGGGGGDTGGGTDEGGATDTTAPPDTEPTETTGA